jgi:hypothetical protein
MITAKIQVVRIELVTPNSPMENTVSALLLTPPSFAKTKVGENRAAIK